MFKKKEEFEERLEKIKEKLEEKKKFEKRLEELRKRLEDVEKKIEEIKLPKLPEEKINKIEDRVKDFEKEVNKAIEELKLSFNSFKDGIKKDIEKIVSERIGAIASEKIKEGQANLENRINWLKGKVSEVENKINKLLETLEAV